MLQTIADERRLGNRRAGFVPKLSASPGSQRCYALAFGHDTDAVLRAAGLTEAQIAALRERGVVG